MLIRLFTLSAAIAALALPVGAAHATTFEGSCELSGAYTQSASGYSIEGGEKDGGCSGALNGVDAGWIVTYSDSGTLSGSCAGGLLNSGSATLDFYSIDLGDQSLTFEDTLELEYAGGVFAPLAGLVRVVEGAAGGRAVETGRVRNCGGEDARYEGGFRGANLSD